MLYFNIYLYCSLSNRCYMLFAECRIRTEGTSFLVICRLQWQGWVVDVGKQGAEMVGELCFQGCHICEQLFSQFQGRIVIICACILNKQQSWRYRLLGWIISSVVLHDE